MKQALGCFKFFKMLPVFLFKLDNISLCSVKCTLLLYNLPFFSLRSEIRGTYLISFSLAQITYLCPYLVELHVAGSFCVMLVRLLFDI